MKLNTKQRPVTHEGGKAAIISPIQELRRTVMSCLLWEDEFYESGQSIADRIERLVHQVPTAAAYDIAYEARSMFNLRHVPLLILSVKPNAMAIYNTIQRADEITELLSIYWRNGKKPIPAQMKKGLAKAFTKFDEYSLAKYNRDGAIKLRDVLFMVHAKPKDKDQADLWKRLVNGELQTPDTWEVSLSAGKDKKESFERLLKEGKLGYLALLRNLRNMNNALVDESLVRKAILEAKGAERVLPFRFVAAARHAMNFEPELDIVLKSSIERLPKLKGNTAVLIDVSGSMDQALSWKSDMTRMDAAAALGAIVNAESLSLFTFSNNVMQVPPRKGMAGVDAIIRSQQHGSTYLRGAIEAINKIGYDRIIVITDEQSHDGSCDPLEGSKAYMINVASNKNGVGYGKWVHIDGFSENVLRYIHESEQ